MKKSKKLLMTLSLFSLVSTLSGCSKNSNPSTTSNITTSSTSSTSSVEPEVTPTFKYTVNDNNEITITEINDDTITDLVIPDEIDGKKVVEVSLEEGSYGRNVKSIKFGKNVSNIELYNVYFENLEKIEVDENNETYLSKDNGIYSKYKWRRSDQTLYRSLYYGCKGIVIPEKTVEGYEDVEIDRFAFQNSNIESINIPSNVSGIYISDRKHAFLKTKNLKTITVDKNNTTYNDGNGSNVIIRSSGNGNYLIATDNKYTIPTDTNICNKIDAYTFFYCDAETIVIPDNIISIASDNFSFSPNLTTIKIGSGLVSFSCYFQDCPLLKNFVISSTNTNFKFENNMLINNSTIKYYTGSEENITIDSKFSTIGEYAFTNNKYIKNITLSKSTTLRYCCFNGSTLETINLEKVSSWSNLCFKNCKNLKTITVPSTLEFGVAGVFDGATIEKLILSQKHSLSYNGGGCIDGCQIKELEFLNDDNKYKITSNKHVLSTDETKFYFTYGDEKNIVVDDTVTVIYNLSLCNIKVDSVTFPQGLTAIYSLGVQADIKSLDLPNLTTIGSQAFKDINLEEITLHEGLTKIDSFAFYNTKIKSLVIPASVTTLGSTEIIADTPCEYLEIKNKDLVFGEYTLGSSNIVKTFKYHGTMIDFKKSFTTKKIFDKNFPKLETLQLLDSNGEFINYPLSDLTW